MNQTQSENHNGTEMGDRRSQMGISKFGIRNSKFEIRKRVRRHALLATVLALGWIGVASSLQAQSSLASWDFSTLAGGTGVWPSSPYAATTSNADVTVVGLTRGSGLVTGASTSVAANAFGAAGWDGTGAAAEAITRGDFITFAITANSGKTVSFTQIGAYNIRRSNTGPTTGQWQYQIGSAAFNNIGSTITWGYVLS